MWSLSQKRLLVLFGRKKTELKKKKTHHSPACWIISGKHAVMQLGGTEHSWPTLHTTWERWAILGKTVLHVPNPNPVCRCLLCSWPLQASWVLFCVVMEVIYELVTSVKLLINVSWAAFLLIGVCLLWLAFVWRWSWYGDESCSYL